MPFQYNIIRELDLLWIKARGRLTPQHLQDCVYGYHAEPAFHAQMNLLYEIGDDIEADFGREDLLEDVTRRVRETREKRDYRMACARGTTHEQTFFLASMEMINRYAEIDSFDFTLEAVEWLCDV